MPKFKLGENGAPVFSDGKFTLVLDDGSETAFDALGAYSTFGVIRKERDDAKDEAKAAKAALAAFGGTEEERSATLTLAKQAKALGDKKLIDAGKVDEVVEARLKDATAEWTKEREAYEAKLSESQSSVRKHLISSRFATTKALEKTILTPDLVEAMFGTLFDLEGDQVVSYRDGSKKEKLYSRADPSKVADFDEALSIHLSQHPNYSKWKAGTGATGGGAPGAASAAGGQKSVTRPQFDAMAPEAKLEFIRSKGTVAEAA